MNTPICDFIEAYVKSGATRLHMPGHKGVGAVESLDITEVEGADVLYHGQGIIAQSQDNAARLFGAAKTLYSTEGSSLAIRAMVYLLRLYVGRRPVIAAARNAHKTFVTAAALLDADVRWIFPREQTDILSCKIDAGELEMFLQENKADALYITSPDYLGNLADVSRFAEICHRYGVLLLVDNAHGAYLRFLQEDMHPITLGADMCCDSAHKTLPVLTGGAYLHIGKGAPELFSKQAQKAMGLFASTSPSYLTMGSLDACNRYLFRQYRQSLQAYVPVIAQLKKTLTDAGYALRGEEPLKLTIAPKSYGYTGEELAAILAKQNMVCEFSDPDYVVLMLTPHSGMEVLERLKNSLLEIPKKVPVTEKAPGMVQTGRKISMHEAMLQAGEEVPLRKAVGRVLAAPTVSCPPAIPVLVCGEIVTAEAVRVMEYYGIETLEVI